MPGTKQGGSRERMLEAAISLMRHRGLSGAGINEVIRESGAPKGSLYHYFPGGKQQLAADALALYAGRVRGFIDATLATSKSPAGKIQVLFDAFAKRAEDAQFQASCAAGAVSLDLEPGLEPLRDVIDAAFADWAVVIGNHFRSRHARDAESFGRLVLTVIEGAYIRCRAEHSSEPFREAGRWLSGLAAATFDQ